MKKLCFLFVLLIFSLSEARVFTDVSEYSWAASVIDKWSDRGIISGYVDGSFRGNNNLKRSEMITVINKLNNSKEKMEAKPAKDVNTGDWYYDEMSTALKNGLIELDENFNLRPNDYATREEVFVILAKLFKLKYSGNSAELLSSRFQDYYLINGENYPYIAALVSENYISGYENNTLKSKAPITRAELIALIDKMVEEAYSFGEIQNKFINGNVVINGEGVSLTNTIVAGNIFIMDGAKNEAPILKSIDCTKGIISRIGTVLVLGNDMENRLEDKEKVEPVLVRARYSEEDWTNEDVTVTITFNDTDYDIMNNSGRKTYYFEENGEFTFYAQNSEGNIVDFKAKVNNIDKIKPKFATEVNAQIDKATITLTIENDELSPIKGSYFMKDINSSANTIKNGEKIIDNVFEVTEEGRYTIVVEDEAGNRTRELLMIKLGVETDGVQN